MIVQKSNEKVRRALERYYSSGGYASSPLGEGQYAKKQGDDIFKVIRQSLLERKKTVKNTTFLEIGAGYGYLLYLLKKEGAKDILGLEPGKEGIEGSKKYGVPFMHDFFPSQSLKKDFDFIFSYAVLEHIENPLFILKEIYKKLNDKGMTFIFKIFVGFIFDSILLSHIY